jgi:hypothetical protein
VNVLIVVIFKVMLRLLCIWPQIINSIKVIYKKSLMIILKMAQTIFFVELISFK